MSDEARISKYEIESLANYVWLSLEKTKRTAKKELLRLQQEIDTIDPKEKTKIEALQEQIQEQIKRVTQCKKQQTEGYLAYVYAKAESIHLEKGKKVPFVMPQTTLYGPTLIIPYWPVTYQPWNYAYDDAKQIWRHINETR